MAYVSLSQLPSAPKSYSISLGGLYGGLNTSRLPHEISSNQMADCCNVIWRDGMVRSRKGMLGLNGTENGAAAFLRQELELPHADFVFQALYRTTWHNRLVMAYTGLDADMTYIVSYNMKRHEYELLTAYLAGLDGARGSFFQFGEKLYYKSWSVYLELSFSVDEDTGAETISASEVQAYTPIIQVNTKRDGVGDLYQPENRLSPHKEVWFNGDAGIRYVEIACDGRTNTFHLGYSNPFVANGLPSEDGNLREIVQLFVGAELLHPSDYTVNFAEGTVTILDGAPAIGLKLSVKLRVYALDYVLPVVPDEVCSVFVKNLATGDFVQETRYSHQQGSKTISFAQIADIIPANADANVLNNFIKVTYRKENTDAMDSISSCGIAETFGASGIETNCIVMAGSERQPNAIFWSGNDGTGANPGYFPMEQYNLVGRFDEKITAFGRQQNRLVIFQPERVSSAAYDFATVDGRLRVSMNIRNINDKIGCDLPDTVQLISNNLVWANSNLGVMYLKDSTYAYENMIAFISENVNESPKLPYKAAPANGLISALQNAKAEGTHISSFDDGSHYWLTVGTDAAYVWDYDTHPYTADTSRLCWWVMTDIPSIAWAVDEKNQPYAVADMKCSPYELFTFQDDSNDFGGAIAKTIQMQTQIFGTFDRLKNVDKLILQTGQLAPVSATVTYITDYGAREDLTQIHTVGSAVAGHEGGAPIHIRKPICDVVHVRKPRCLHIHSFAVRIDCNGTEDLSLIYAQILYNYGSRTKAGLRI